MIKGFYPTPKKLIRKMVSKLKPFDSNWQIPALDPSAGKGDIIELLTDDYKYRNMGFVFSAIEKDPDLRATLRGKRIKVIDTDFLVFNGPDKFDLIIANPPFDEGDKHLLKAIDIMYRGQIVFLLNAETIKNPYTNIRKDLARKLEELDADIEYVQNAFKNSERPTGVEIALVYINIEREVEDDLFAGVDDKAEKATPEFKESFEVSNRKRVQELVAEYNQTLKIGHQTIVDYYKNYRKIGGYIGLNAAADKYSVSRAGDNLTAIMQAQLNGLIASVRNAFWRRCLDLPEVYSRMTKSKREEFESTIKHRCDMDFTENNIRQFVLNLIGGYEKTLTDAVISLFDKFSYRHSYDGRNPREKNIHYFNGWKTNDAFKVGKKVILPVYGGSWNEGPFRGYSGKWELQYGAVDVLRDIDVVMSYFDGMNRNYYSICEALEHSFSQGVSSKIESTYFTLTAHKKGTLHLIFNDEGILRRFNVVACKGKNWLPQDYGRKPFKELPHEEMAVADSFEGQKSYNENLNRPLFGKISDKNLLPEEIEPAQATLFDME